MGFSTSGAVAIIFVGLLVAVGIAYPVVQTAHEDRMTAIDDRDERTLDVRNTDVELAAHSYDDTAGELTVNVTNTGTTTLSVPATDLLVDGQYLELSPAETHVETDDEREIWQPGEQLSIVIESGEHAFEDPDRIKLVTEHGVAETAEVDDGG